jgi:endonuclease/exonuclease/phosphatase family metal-dependent hydrolase
MSNIKIFSWNVCWECMTNSSYGSARELGKKCINNICKNNILNIINNLINDEYDFIALQEASNLLNDLNKFPNYGIIHVNQNPEELITLYNTKKYIVNAIKYGEIMDNRPYQIIFLYDNYNKKNIIFINLHNAHLRDKNYKNNIIYLETMLSNELNLGIINDNNFNNFINIQNINQNKDISLFFDKDAYVISAGDFNDHDNGKYFINFRPFSQSNTILKDIILSTKGIKPPNTCCSTHVPPYDLYKFRLYGDYILFSNNFDIFKNNEIFYNNKITSDHLPVYAILQIDQKFKLKSDIHSLKFYLTNIENNKELLHIGQEILNTDILETPNKLYYNSIISDQNYLVYIYKYNQPSIIGYIRLRYLTKFDKNFKVNRTTTLRFIDDLRDPNEYDKINNKLFKGPTVYKDDIVCIANNNIIDDCIILQVLNDRNKIGYVKLKNIEKN